MLVDLGYGPLLVRLGYSRSLLKVIICMDVYFASPFMNLVTLLSALLLVRLNSLIFLLHWCWCCLDPNELFFHLHNLIFRVGLFQISFYKFVLDLFDLLGFYYEFLLVENRPLVI